VSGIGAGATAKSTIDWHSAWQSSEQRMAFEKELHRFHTRNVDELIPLPTNNEEFAVPINTQFAALFQRCVQVDLSINFGPHVLKLALVLH
jgi:ATP-binding cassette subfamily G (WHITE) protein 2 (SNQ2)